MSLDFGKYKDNTIQEVYEKDADYCRWLSKQELLLTEEVKDFLNDKFNGDDGTYILRWGKFKNHTIRWIFDNQQRYFQWLMKSDFVQTKCPKLKKEIDELNNQ